MSEPVDIQISKRSEFFVPDEFRLLVYVGSKFDVLQRDCDKLALERWKAQLDDALSKDKLACNREKIAKDAPVRDERAQAIRERFEASKVTDVERYTADFKAFKPLAPLPLCVSDGRNFLKYALTTFNVAPKNCALFCSAEDYPQIVYKFKDWDEEESKAPAPEDEIVNTWEDAEEE